MTRFAMVTVTFLLLSLIFPAAAAGITLGAGQQDYYFLTGQRIGIPLVVTSTFPGDMPGTVRFSTDAQLQKTGTVMITTENRVFAHTVPAGQSFLNLTLAPSSVPRDYKVHVAYYYTDPSPVNASLPEFYIHVVTDPGLIRNIPEPLGGTTLPENGEIPSESSVSMAEQAVSVREQMGSDTGKGLSSSGGQSPAGTGADREQQQRDREEQERVQAELDALLAQDPLVSAMNRSLSAGGFIRQSVDTRPSGNRSGTFSMLYRQGAYGRVIVQGPVVDGVVPFVSEVSNVPVTADTAIDLNTTFQSYARTLADLEYDHKETVVNRSLAGVVANISYTASGGNKAYINATTTGDRVTTISLEREPVPAGLLPVLFLITVSAILVIAGGYFYRRHHNLSRSSQESIDAIPAPVFDHRAEAEQILNDAELASGRQDYAEAYRLMARALRVFLSYQYGSRDEVTSPEIVTILRAAGRDTAEVERILNVCSDVAFARGTPDKDEFHRMIDRVRAIIRA